MRHVIFGTGPLGQSVMRALLAQGETDIRMVNRNGGRGSIPAEVEVIATDAYDPANVRTVIEGAEVVYQCAQPAYDRWQENFPPLQTSIIDGVAVGDAKLIVGENLYMYGAIDGPIHEDLPYNAHTKKGRVRAEMSRQLIHAHEKGRIRVVMARGSDFYGPGVTGSTLGERIFEPLLKGKTAQCIGNVDLPHTYTVIDDFGAAMVTLGQHDEALGQAWHVPNPPTRTTRELVEMIAAEIGVEPKINAMGKLMMRIGSLFISEARETVEMMYEFEQPFVVDDSKFKQAFGDIATPHRQAIQDTVTWYRQQTEPIQMAPTRV